MNTALVYILSSLTLVVIMTITKGGRSGQGLDDEFRYQSGLLKVLLFCSFVPMSAIAFIYAVATPRPSGMGLALFVGCGVAGTALFLYGYRYLKSFVISVRDDGVMISSIKGGRVVSFDAVKKVIYLNPRGSGGILCLYDNRGKRLVEFSESISGIEELAKMIEVKSKRFGVLFEVTKRRI